MYSVCHFNLQSILIPSLTGDAISVKGTHDLEIAYSLDPGIYWFHTIPCVSLPVLARMPTCMNGYLFGVATLLILQE